MGENVRADEQGEAGEAFRSKVPEGVGIPMAAWVVAALVVLAVVGGLIYAGRHRLPEVTGQAQPLDPYATNLPLTGLIMSESASLAGGKSTFIDGKVNNVGGKTVTRVIVQVIFRNDENLAPQIETVPMWLIRVREPYIDTEAVSAAPLKPGDEHDFRLIFETMPRNWNNQMPEVNVVRVTGR